MIAAKISEYAGLSDNQGTYILKIVKDDVITMLESLARGTRECAANAALLSYTESNTTTRRNEQKKAVNLCNQYLGMIECINNIRSLR